MNVITESQIYWLTRCDGIRSILGWNTGWGVLFALTLILGAVLYFTQTFGDNKSCISLFSDYTDDDMHTVKSHMRRIAKFSIASSITVLCCCCIGEVMKTMIPTNKEMAAIMVIPRIANSQSVQDIGSGIVDLAKEWMTELSPKHKETVKEESK